MHILHVTPYYAPAYSFGGVVAMVEGLAQAQIKHGHTVTILTSDAYTVDKPYTGAMDEIRDGVRVVRCPNWVYPLRRYNLNTPFAMTQHARDIIPTVDIIHLHEFRTVENLLIAPIASKNNKPIILSPHGTLTYSTGRSALKSLWDRVLSPHIAKQINAVIALADPELADARRTWQQFKHRPYFTVIPNGVYAEDYRNLPEPNAFREKYNLGSAQVILFMGRLQKRKGVDLLAQAFHQANLPNTKLLIVGPDEGMRETIQAIPNDNIILTGFLGGEERLSALSVADLFVLPAIGEGLSMAVLEALASGIPVLLSEGCNMPIVAQAQAGKIIPVDVEAIATALRIMLSNDSALQNMADNAKQLIQQHYTWDNVASQMDQVYTNFSKP